MSDPIIDPVFTNSPSDFPEPEIFPETQPRYPLFKPLYPPLIGVLVGVLCLVVASLLDYHDTAKRPWINALMAINVPATEKPQNALPLRAIQLPLPDHSLFSAIKATPQGKEILQGFKLHGEWVLDLETQPDTLAPLLASGRLPEPGKPEAVAGYLAKANTFQLNGKTYTVTGRFHRSVGVLGYAYVLPHDASLESVFVTTSGVKSGWIAPEADKTLLENLLANESKTDTEEVIATPGRSASGIIFLTLLGLILIAFGGCRAYLHVFRALKERFTGPIAKPLFQAMTDHPYWLAASHLLLYGVFFLFMTLGTQFPTLQAHLLASVQHQFTEGALSNVGNAYLSGDIIAATSATFEQNYVVATLLATFVPSLILPFAGLVKNVLTFAVVGFIMSPTEISTAERLIYHSITMVLEFEAYIIAVFVITLWPIMLVQGLRYRKPGAFVINGLRLQVSGALACGVMLLIAAFYEAVTLIYFGRF